MKTELIKNIHPNETIVICDNDSWVWDFITTNLIAIDEKHVRLSSSISLYQSWNRVKNAKNIIILWENTHRSGGGIVEEILEVSPYFNVTDKVIVLTTNPTHEDVIYFNELDIRKILRINQKYRRFDNSDSSFIDLLMNEKEKNPTQYAWQKILRVLRNLSKNSPLEIVNKISDAVERAYKSGGMKPNSIYYDALASIAMLRSEPEKAVKLWQKALDVNPNYYRTYNNLIDYYQENDVQKALALMQKMQALNKNNLSRIVKMGYAHLNMDDYAKAGHYFELALEKDRYCSKAINGLAEIYFNQGNLDQARKLLRRSQLAHKTSSRLNQKGIKLVKIGLYEEALSHYLKAQYVLPQQEKGPMLFYNIGLCYSKWGKYDEAKRFLEIALIKEPNYKKAKKLIEHICNNKS